MKKTKFLMLSMALTAMTLTPINALAATTDVTANAGSAEVTVTSELESTFSVGIPTEVIIDPSTSTGSYQVSVKGDLDSKYKLKVSAVDSYLAENGDTTSDVNFLLKDVSSTSASIARKSDIVVNVSQEKTEFIHSELNSSTPILVNATLEAKSPITAGEWKSTVTYRVSLEEAM